MNAYDNDRNEEALSLIEACAEGGDPVACFRAAIFYRDGIGTTIDLKRSASWLLRLKALAEKGNHEAQWELSQSYRFGDMFPQDIAQANYWLELAAEGGFGEAQHHLAWYYETGQYTYSIDSDKAIIWNRRAFEQGHPETLYTAAVSMFVDGAPTDEAMRLLEKAANKGFKQAAYALQKYARSSLKPSSPPSLE